MPRNTVFNIPFPEGFNFERYELSKQLPSIIKSLSEKTTLVCHAGYGNFATVKVLNSNVLRLIIMLFLKYLKKPKSLDYIL